MQRSRARAGRAEDTGIRRINVQIRVKVEEREDPKEDMARRGSRHHRRQASQGFQEEERITKGANMARLRESRVKAKAKDRAGYAMDLICSEIAPKVEGKEVDIQVRRLSTAKGPG